MEARCSIKVVSLGAHVCHTKNLYRFMSDKAFTSAVTSIIFPASQYAYGNRSELGRNAELHNASKGEGATQNVYYK